MLPRRFALIRHVDYTGAGTGVIAYGVAFDDGQVVLRWSSAHRATSVLDSVEDLIAAHGHGETTSIEWIDAPPGKSDAPAQQGGRRARRSSPLDDAPPATEVPGMPPPEAARTEAAETGPAAHEQQEPAPGAESAEVRPASPAPQAPPFNEPAPTPPVAPSRAPTASPAGAGRSAAPVPATPAAFAQPAASAQPPAPPAKPSTPANGISSPPASPVPEIPAAPAPTVHTSSPSNDATRSSSSTEPADVPPSGRTARHEVIATQPMDTDLSEDRGQRRPRRAAAPPHESPRSIFEEAEEPPRPDLRLAGSNGRSREHDDSDDSVDTSPGGEDFGGYFSPGHQHLDTVTGLLDLPAGLDKRGRGSAAEDDAMGSRRNGRHRGE